MLESILADRKFAALLFDMDGTILNSIAAAESIWGKWAEQHGLNVVEFLSSIHGVRASETIAKLGLPEVDPEKEAAKITQEEIKAVSGVVEIPGATVLLNSLPPNKWAVVTSAPLDLAHSRLKAAGLPIPNVLVTAEDVRNGKPDPECYFYAAEKLGVNISECLIFEDATAGILAAEASMAQVIVVRAVHSSQEPIAQLSIIDYREHLDLFLDIIK